MASNFIDPGDRWSGALSAPATPTSGDPGVLGQIPVVALTDEADGGNAAGEVTFAMSGIFECPVTGANAAGNTAVAIGDIIYWDSTVLNKDNTNGIRWGYALGAVSSGATTTIKVKVGY